MKVCLLTPEFLPEWGGVGTYAYNLAMGLRQRSAEVHIVTGHGGDDGIANGGLDGVEVHPLCPSNGTARPVSPLRFQLAVLRRLPSLAHDHGWEIIHANHAYMSDLFSRWRSMSASTVLTVHTTLDTQIGGTVHAGLGVPRERTEAKVARLRFPLRALERRYLRKTRSMIFVSRWVQDRMIARYGFAPHLSDVIPNAIDKDLFSPHAGHEVVEPPTLLFAGRLLALKGIATLLRAVAQLPPHIRAVFAGPGNPEPWRDYARRLGVAPERVKFLGRVPYRNMPALCRRASAVILPSYSESCPMIALEAMASGTPLIAAAAGGVPEIVRHEETGWLFPPGDAEALATIIDDVLADRVQRDLVIARARAWVEGNASIERMAARTIGFYERALSAGVAS